MRRRADLVMEEETQFEEVFGDLDLEDVRQGRKEEMNCVAKTLGMFEFGSRQEATFRSRQGSDHDEMDRSSEEGR